MVSVGERFLIPKLVQPYQYVLYFSKTLSAYANIV